MNKLLDFTEFPASSIDTWRSLVQKELKEQSFESLIWKDDNGIVAEPYLTAYAVRYEVPDRPVASWRISQRATASNPELLHESVMQMLAGGAQRIELNYIFSNKEELEIVLKDVLIDIISIGYQVSTWAEARQLMQWLVEIASERQLDSQKLEGSIQVQADALLKDANEFLSAAQFASLHLNKMRVIVLDADVIHNAHGNDVQELTYSIAQASELIQRLLEGGMNIDQVSALFLFRFQTGTSYFVQIAKFQAFRALWATLVKASDPMHACSIHCMIEAINSQRDQSEKDAFNNILRATTEATSAIAGQVDFVQIEFTAQYAEGFRSGSSRIARNLLHILAEESYLTSIGNPARGAWFIAQLTDQLIEKSWKSFQRIEESGGIQSAIGSLMQDVKEVADARKKAFDAGKRVMIGVNKYQPKA